MSVKMARRRAREFALQGIYQWLLSGNSAAIVAKHLETEAKNFSKADHDYFSLLLHGVLNNIDTLQHAFAPFIHRSVEELSPIERTILLLSTYEFLHSPETPYRVIINEAIELAKSYGATDGHRFINGVLDKLALELRSVEVEATRTPPPKET